MLGGRRALIKDDGRRLTVMSLRLPHRLTCSVVRVCLLRAHTCRHLRSCSRRAVKLGLWRGHEECGDSVLIHTLLSYLHFCRSRGLYDVTRKRYDWLVLFLLYSVYSDVADIRDQDAIFARCYAWKLLKDILLLISNRNSHFQLSSIMCRNSEIGF